jgi:integrase/predicted DNA-binding transcriptional regulator AlpA
MTVAQTSSYLQVSKVAVYRYTKLDLPHMKLRSGILRFRQSDLDTWVERHRRNSPSAPKKYGEAFTNPPRRLLRYEGRNQPAVSKSGKSKTRYYYLGRSGSINKRRTKKWGVRFYINFTGAEGERIQKVVKHAQTAEDAVAALMKELEGIEAQRNGFKKPERIKFRDFADRYLEKYAQTNKRSWKTDRSYLKSMSQVLGERFLDEITAEDVEEFKTHRLEEDRVEKSTVNRCLAIMRKLFNIAVEWGYLRREEVPKFKLFPEGNILKERTLSEDEERRLLAASSPHLRSILVVALNSGCRLGEILGLKWGQIDLEARTLRVERTKNNKIRMIPINTALLEELSRLSASKRLPEYVFVNPETGAAYGSIKTAFAAACRRAKIEGLRFHDLRHTFASRLIASGVDLITVKDLLGHSSVRITEKYSHSNLEQKKKAVEVLNDQKSLKIDPIPSLSCKIRVESDFSPPSSSPSYSFPIN